MIQILASRQVQCIVQLASNLAFQGPQCGLMAPLATQGCLRGTWTPELLDERTPTTTTANKRSLPWYRGHSAGAVFVWFSLTSSSHAPRFD